MNLNATSSLHRNDDKVTQNGGRPVYDVCPVGTRDPAGTVWLGPDDRWHINGPDGDAWPMVADAVRLIMQNAEGAAHG